MCPHCADGFSHPQPGPARIAQLLALLEQPGALPPDAALRIARELLHWAGRAQPGLVCEPVAPPAAPLAA